MKVDKGTKSRDERLEFVIVQKLFLLEMESAYLDLDAAKNVWCTRLNVFPLVTFTLGKFAYF